MDENLSIKVTNVQKKFATSLRRSMAYGTIDMTRNFVGIPSDYSHLRKGEFWALKDINFELKKGEVLGIIGVNGSGKSTLLRILTGIFPPDVGTVELRGNVGALIAVGAGFHPHMTGRGNIYLNGTILGMSKKEIDEKFDSIVDFAEVGRFLDSPVSTYSSGMKVRLGFAIAVHRIPEILLVDEILSVGDIAFRKKCMQRMNELKGKSSIIFISHNMNQVERICDKCILLDHGEVLFYGETIEAIRKYEEITLKSNEVNTEDLMVYETTNDIENLSLVLKNSAGEKANKFFNGEKISFDIDFVSSIETSNSIMGVTIFDDEGAPMTIIKNIQENKSLNVKKGGNHIHIKVPVIPFMPGRYRINLRLKLKDNTTLFDAGGVEFAIQPTKELVNVGGKVRVPTEWEIS